MHMIRHRFSPSPNEGASSNGSRLRSGPGLYIAATVALTALLSLPVIRPLLPRLATGRDVSVADEVTLGVIPWVLSVPGVRTGEANRVAFGRGVSSIAASEGAQAETPRLAGSETAERLGQIRQPEGRSEGENRDRRREPPRGHQGESNDQPDSRTARSGVDEPTAPDDSGERPVEGGSDGPSGGDGPGSDDDGAHRGHEGDRDGHRSGDGDGRGDRDRGGDDDGPRGDDGGDRDRPRRDRGGDDDGPRGSDGRGRGHHGSDGRATTRGGGHRGRRIRSSTR
jgi:hypothetical protein